MAAAALLVLGLLVHQHEDRCRNRIGFVAGSIRHDQIEILGVVPVHVGCRGLEGQRVGMTKLPASFSTRQYAIVSLFCTE